MHNLGSLDVLFSRLLMLNILYIFSGTSLPLSPNSLCIFVLQANVYPRLWNWSCLFVSYQFISTFFFSLFNHCTSLPQADVYSGPWLLSLLFQSNPQENPGHGEEPKKMKIFMSCLIVLYLVMSNSYESSLIFHYNKFLSIKFQELAFNFPFPHWYDALQWADDLRLNTFPRMHCIS